MTQILLCLLIGLLIGFAFGWGFAHNAVATECERLGSFFVGEKVYECKLKNTGEKP